MTDALNLALVAMILGLAVWTIVARETFAAIAGFIVYGLLLTLIWVQLSAIDVALEREIRTERPRGDIAAYAGVAPSADEVANAAFRPASPDLADDTDWEALYGDAD